MKKALACLLLVAGCAAQTKQIPIRGLVPENDIAFKDGTPTGTIFAQEPGFGSPQYGQAFLTVTFNMPDGKTLSGNMSVIRQTQTTNNIFGQPVAQTVSNEVNVTIVASNGAETMDCDGTMASPSLDMTCRLSDGAIYRDVH